MAIISQPHRIAYFPVPKNACSTGKEWMHWLATGEFFGRRPMVEGGIPLAVHAVPGYSTSKLLPRDIVRTKGCFRFAILRDPAARLVSAYKNRVLYLQRLSEETLGAEALRAAGVPPDPDFDRFLEHLEIYAGLSGDLAHHIAPHIAYLGEDPKLFDRLYRMDEMESLRADLSRQSGREVPMPPVGNASRNFPTPVLTAAHRRRIEAFYARDYEVFGPLFGTPKIAA